MITYTIKSNGGHQKSIHDISGACDRIIKFPKNAKFAIVLADFYGGKGYTTHKTEHATMAMAKKMQDYSFVIMDSNGDQYDDYYGERLIKKDR